MPFLSIEDYSTSNESTKLFSKARTVMRAGLGFGMRTALAFVGSGSSGTENEGHPAKKREVGLRLWTELPEFPAHG
jgi:hypothetical protein